MTDLASQNETRTPAPRKDSTSGYRGVSWHKGAGKWGAYIRRNGVRRFLGLYDTAEAASAAYLDADALLRVETPDRRAVILETVRALYDEHGPRALATPFLSKADVGPTRLRNAGFGHAELLHALGLTEVYAEWRRSTYTYAGQMKPRMSWAQAVAAAEELRDREGDLPTVQWCRLNGYGALTSYVHASGRTWEELRAAIGLPPSDKFYTSRVGLRWRSRPEASLSNFLCARGVEHKRGERYPDGYAAQSGRAYGRYDLHFKSRGGDWIDVEIWGDIPDAYSHGRYRRTRALKEAWRAGDPNFLGLQYQDCLSDAKLTALLEPFIGVIAPFRFEKLQDRQIETAHWSDADEFLETCRELAAQMPDGVFPGDEWLRKRGRYADRPGPAYNTIAQRVNAWIGGTRRVRELLGQSEASTTKWTPERVIEAWRKFEAEHDLTPAQCKGAAGKRLADPAVVAEGARIYEVARRLGVIDQAREGRTVRKVKWTPERAIAEWRRFERAHGLSPSQAMGPAQRARLPREVANAGARIYSAAKKLGVVAVAKTPPERA